jgi:hypothetical protein
MGPAEILFIQNLFCPCANLPAPFAPLVNQCRAIMWSKPFWVKLAGAAPNSFVLVLAAAYPIPFLQLYFHSKIQFFALHKIPDKNILYRCQTLLAFRHFQIFLYKDYQLLKFRIPL